MGIERRQWAEALLSTHQESLVRYAASILGDRDAARDVAQEAFVRLMREEHCEEPVPWLFRVCRNYALDALRKQRRIVPMDEAAFSRTAGTEPQPGNEMEQREEAAALLALVEELPASQREVIRLRFQQSFSYREISVITGLSINHVGVALHGGLKALRARLSHFPQNQVNRRAS